MKIHTLRVKPTRALLFTGLASAVLLGGRRADTRLYAAKQSGRNRVVDHS